MPSAPYVPGSSEGLPDSARRRLDAARGGTGRRGLFTSDRLAGLNGVGDPGLFYSGSFHQVLVQMLGVGAAFAAVFTISYLVFGAIKATYGLRVTDEEERNGLDIAEHGMWGYPERFMPIPGGEYHPGEIAVHVDRARRPAPTVPATGKVG